MNAEHIRLPESLSTTHELHRLFWDETAEKVKTVYAAAKDDADAWDGPVWFFREDGSLKSEGDYVDGNQRGEWRYYEQDGALHLTEDWREDGSVYCVFWDGKKRSTEGLRRLAEGRWVNDGPWKQYDDAGKHDYTQIYEMGTHVRNAPNPAPVIAAMKRHAKAADQLRAMKKAAKHEQLYQYLEPLHQTGELSAEVALSVVLDAWCGEWQRTFPIVLSYGEALRPALEAATKRELAEQYPNDNRAAQLCLWRWELDGSEPLPADYHPLLFKAMSYNAEFSDHKRHTVERLRELVASYPDSEREALVMGRTAPEQWQRGRPLYAYAGLAPTGEAVAKAIEEVVGLKKSTFRYNPSRTATLLAFLQEAGAVAVPALIESLGGKGKKAQGRQILVQALARSGAAEAAAPLLEHVDDKVEEAARAAREGLEALGEAALPALQAALDGRKKGAKVAAAEMLAKLEPTDAVRAVAQARLKKEKAKEIRALLEPVAAGKSGEAAEEASLPPVAARIAAARGTLADRREAIIGSLEPDRGYSVVEKNAKKLVGDEPDVAVVLMDRLIAAHRQQEPAIVGLSWETILWPLKAKDEQLAAWLAAALCAAVEEKRPYNLKYVLPNMARVAEQELAAALSWHLASGEPVPATKPILRWLVEQNAAEAIPAFVACADDRSKAVRSLATEGLIALGEAALQAVHPLLGGSTRQKAVAAEMLRATPSAVSVAPLQAALNKEKNAKRSEALSSALMACKLAAGEVDAATLDAALASRAPAEVPAVKSMPTLRWSGGAQMSDGAARWLLGALTAEDGSGPPNAELWAVRAKLEDGGCHALCDAIVDSFPEDNDHRWVRYQRAVIGDDAAMAALGGALERDVYQHSAAFAAHGVEVLRRNPTPAAVRWLDHWSRKAKGKLEREAEAAMTALVSGGDLDRDDLVDMATPTASDGASVADVAERLEAAMCTARRWTRDRWRAFFVDHPVVSKLAPRLLFATFDADGGAACFRVEDGEAVDAEGQPVKLGSDARVGIAHPVELADEVIAAWAGAFDAPPFAQLDRPFARDARKALDAALPSRPVATGDLIDGLERLGYVPDSPEDAGLIYGARRRVGSRWTLRLSHDGYVVSTRRAPDSPTSKIEGIYPDGPEGDTAPEALYSEALNHVRELA